ncbi:septation protein SepH [Amycolatopsis sp. PS_44_ISF1]|uniref:septation protein SepH n=1 Tax=Amycolatopsis sp. PS_44_ISF1 TaxID=2974917 RepID=UPI0028DF519F|nr:septation protein SepH [Amycolatopsis sp. PS_44_ISF1]MDT8911175.1 septation protein SepH [Amycolatopsis sp. PS_44_ISF1]
MRALRVIGLHEDGKSIVLEDPASRTRFLLPADERLRAAARGDIARLGQIEIELESQMRPREIQARIRAGESVEQVAGGSGVSMQRVERFAYPVLLERSRTAELAQSAHPVREDGPDVQTLGEVIAYAFGVRGHDYGQARWDSWRGDDGKWVVVLRWKAGRSDNRAHWSFAPGAHGGTVTALDENAEVLLNPNAYRAPRTVRALEPTRDAVIQPTLDSASADEVLAIEAPSRPKEGEEDDTREIPRVPPSDDDAAADPDSDEPRTKAKKNHPIVPSWEDVLLGVRSQRG